MADRKSKGLRSARVDALRRRLGVPGPVCTDDEAKRFHTFNLWHAMQVWFEQNNMTYRYAENNPETGIVIIDCPDGSTWDFTLPMKHVRCEQYVPEPMHLHCKNCGKLEAEHPHYAREGRPYSQFGL